MEDREELEKYLGKEIVGRDVCMKRHLWDEILKISEDPVRAAELGIKPPEGVKLTSNYVVFTLLSMELKKLEEEVVFQVPFETKIDSRTFGRIQKLAKQRGETVEQTIHEAIYELLQKSP